MDTEIILQSQKTIIHNGYKLEDHRQDYVNYAYKLGGIDFVKLIECENGNWDIKSVGDGGHAFGLCQINDLYHNIPNEYYNSRQTQIEYCFDKFKLGTKFYGPNRIIKGVKCSQYVENRFIY